MPKKLLDQRSSTPDSDPEKTGALQGLVRNKIIRTLGAAGTAAALFLLSGCVGPEKKLTAGIEQQQRKFEVSRLADLGGLTVLKQTTPKGWTAYFLFRTEDVETLSLDQTEQFMNFFKGKRRVVPKLRFSPKESLEDRILAKLPDGQILFGIKTKNNRTDKGKMQFWHAGKFKKGLAAYKLVDENRFTTRDKTIEGNHAKIIPGPDLASSKIILGSSVNGKFIPTGEEILLGSLPAVIPPKGTASPPSPPEDLQPVSRPGKKTSKLDKVPAEHIKIKNKAPNL